MIIQSPFGMNGLFAGLPTQIGCITAFTIAITELKSLLENVDAGTGARLSKMIIDKLTKRK